MHNLRTKLVYGKSELQIWTRIPTRWMKFKGGGFIWSQFLVSISFLSYFIWIHNLNSNVLRFFVRDFIGRGALPSETGRFNRVDMELRVILGDITKDSRLIALAQRNTLGRSLEQIHDQLARCQRALQEFLDEKRTVIYFSLKFDRFISLGFSTFLFHRRWWSIRNSWSINKPVCNSNAFEEVVSRHR